MKTYEQTCTRLGETLNNILAWNKGEEELGLKNSLFICEDGIMEQYVESKEGEKFHNFVKNISEEEFNSICDEFLKALNQKDLAKMHKALAVFDEMDNYNFGTDVMKRRLLRIRTSTEAESYNLGEQEGIKDFILYKGNVWRIQNG